MIVHLLDVNVLVALLDSAHEDHQLVRKWFPMEHKQGWAIYPITENGFIRIVSGVSYTNLRISPAQAAESLRRLRDNFAQTHHFWPADVSLLDDKLFHLNALAGARETTEAYLAGLAFSHSGRIATLDANISWRAVRGGTPDLINNLTSSRKTLRE